MIPELCKGACSQASCDAHADPEGALSTDDGDAQQMGAAAAAKDGTASGAEATKIPEPAAATPARSDGSENMLFRLADAATMDVDLDGSIGSPPTVQSRCTLFSTHLH